jgi:hypothetical protein
MGSCGQISEAKKPLDSGGGAMSKSLDDKLTEKKMTTKFEASDGGRITTESGIKMITFRAIPYPIAEPFRKQLMAVGKTLDSKTGQLASLIRIEAQIRALFGVEVTRKYMGQDKP